MSSGTPKPPCPSCVLIRRFLVGSVPILLLMLAGVELPALQGFLLTNIASLLIGTGLVALVVWKAWNEYWRK
jgi:disulfide bond formation protein DsbB